MITRESFVVRCHTCRAENSARDRIWRESCFQCAENVADTHRKLGHEVSITAPEEPERRPVDAGRRGW